MKDGRIDQLGDATIGAHLHLILERYTGDDMPTEYAVTFEPPPGTADYPEVLAEQIPALIDELTVLYRRWRDTVAHEDGAA